MTFTAPLGLLALAALPAVVALHLFRNRLPERRVAGLFLFPATAIHSDGGRRRAPLLRSPSFWLECAMALLLAAWLSGPSLAALRPRHLVVVLDDSASMGARETLLRARATLRELAEQHAGGLGVVDQVTVVCTGLLPKVVVGPRADRAALAAFVDGWTPHQPGHAPTAALDLGRQLAGDAEELWLVTDGEPGAPLADVHVRACGMPADNAAVTSARRELHEGAERLRVVVVGRGVGGGEALQRTLRVGDGERELARRPVVLPRDGTAIELVLPLPGAIAQLTVELLVEPHAADGAVDGAAVDALPLDDRVFVVAPSAVEVAVCDRLPAERRRLLQLDRVFAVLPGWRAEADPAAASLLLRDAPGPLRDGQLEVVIAPTAGARGGYLAPFVVDRAHPLLAGAALDGVTWAAGGGDLSGQVLVASGNKVLLAEQWPAAGRRLCFDLDAGAGNLTRAPDWPVLWANVLELAAREAPGWRGHQLRVGEELVFHGDDRRQVVLTGPDGAERARGSGVLSAIADRPGIFRVGDPAAAASGSQAVDRVAVNFIDAAESDLRQRAAFDRPPTSPLLQTADAVADPRPLRRWLALLLVAVVLADWWWLGRGVAGRRA